MPEDDRVLDGLALDPSGEQVAHEVVAGLELALLDLLPEELADAVVASPPALGVVGELE